MSSVLVKRKNSAGANVVEAKTHARASMCELVRYHGTKSMIGFCTILFVSDELLRAIHALLRGSIPYWTHDLVARIHDASHHCNWRKQRAKPLHLTELGMFFSILVLLNASIRMIGILFQCHNHTTIIRHQLWTFWAKIDYSSRRGLELWHNTY